MNPLLIEAVALYWPLVSGLVLAVIWKPNRRQGLGILYAVLWNLAILPPLNGIAMHFQWWTLQSASPQLGGIPLSLWLGWAALWGGLFSLLASRIPLFALLIAGFLLDFFAMPQLAPVLQLQHEWLWGEVLLIALALLPSLLLFQWTSQSRNLAGRTTLIALGFAILVLINIPLAAHGGQWQSLFNAVSDQTLFLKIASLILAIAFSIPPLLAVREFVKVGHGTPVPMDAPQHLVTTGIYSRIRNPMQFGITALLILEAIFLGSILLCIACLAMLVYSLGFAKWSEDADMKARFGQKWQDYRRQVPAWKIRLRKPNNP